MNTKMQNDRMHILLANNDKEDRRLFIEAFEEMRIKTIVKTVNNGDELMNYLTQPDIVLPHILFLELNIPCKKGVDCLTEIRRLDFNKNIAIAIYSTTALEKDIEEAFVKGANVYLKKPADFNTLKKLLEEVVKINWHYKTSGLDRDCFLLNL